jgi:secondary thiamine-phosphate synthase enzyme
MVTHGTVSVNTKSRCHWQDISADVNDVIRMSNIKNGICCIASVHTTAGITINENADPDVERDVFKKLAYLIPEHDSYRHSEGNSDSHVKASLLGLNTTVPVRNGSLVLGTWQSVYFCEFDGPRTRTVAVTIIGEP